MAAYVAYARVTAARSVAVEPRQRSSAGSCCAVIGPQPAQVDLRAWFLVADARGCVLGVVICVALASTRIVCFVLACLGYLLGQLR